MRGQHLLLERAGIEGSGFAAGLAFNQRSADRLNLGITFLYLIIILLVHRRAC